MEKMMTENKVLILSLGKGRSFIFEENKKRELPPKELADILFQRARSAEKFYQRANYRISGSTYEQKSFVADPLIQDFDPDHVIIFGSATSAWSSFYMEYAARPNLEDLTELCEIEASCGIGTCGEELDGYENRINEIFGNSGALKVRRNGEDAFYDFRIILIRYGLDESQLMENYERFQAVREFLYKEKTDNSGKAVPVKNIVSFDITFSFRSLPIYNLAVLNFLENISDYDIEIRNVYYGCFEAKDECLDENGGKIAPIVNLGQIIHILELTNGVSEFGNTGNAITLIRAEKDMKHDFMESLREFDWATQTNDFERIEKALENLSKWDKKSSREAKPSSEAGISALAADSIEMVLTVIKTKLFGDPAADIASFSSLPMETRRYMIAMWYWKQNRYGQAIATALEAMRSLLVPFDLRRRFGEADVRVKSESEQEDENNRRNAEQRLQRIGEGLRADAERTGKVPGPDSMEMTIIEITDLHEIIKEMRNVFAHNLKKSRAPIKIRDEQLVGNPADREYDHPEAELPPTGMKAVESIDRFMGIYQRFREKCIQDPDKFMKIYTDSGLLPHQNKTSPNGRLSGAKILIDLRKKKNGTGTSPEQYLFKQPGGNKYLLPDDIAELCRKPEGAAAVADYFLGILDEKNSEIYLCTRSSKEHKNILPALLQRGFTGVKWMIPGEVLKGSRAYYEVPFSINFVQTPFFTGSSDKKQEIEPLERSKQERIYGMNLKKCRIKKLQETD